MLRTGFGLRCRRCKCSGTARFGKQRVSWIELASERHSFLPGLTLPAGYRIQLACDGFECRWLIVPGVDLQQLEINFLPLRIFLQRIFEDLFRLGVAAIREIHLGFGDRVYLVSVDIA